MQLVFARCSAFLANLQADAGQGLTEYALIVALVAVVAVTALTLLGTNVAAQLTSIAGSV